MEISCLFPVVELQKPKTDRKLIQDLKRLKIYLQNCHSAVQSNSVIHSTKTTYPFCCRLFFSFPAYFLKPKFVLSFLKGPFKIWDHQNTYTITRHDPKFDVWNSHTEKLMLMISKVNFVSSKHAICSILSLLDQRSLLSTLFFFLGEKTRTAPIQILNHPFLETIFNFILSPVLWWFNPPR